MAIRIFKPMTPGTRNRGVSTFNEITKSKPEKTLIRVNHRVKGRNNQGRITIRHRGGGHKKLYRLIDFKRNKYDILGKVASIEYDPNRNARIALIHYEDGEKRYILYPQNLKVNDFVSSGADAEIQIGNSLALEDIPLGISRQLWRRRTPISRRRRLVSRQLCLAKESADLEAEILPARASSSSCAPSPNAIFL